ncbi:MAG TPA: hypothetical protein VGG28_09900 [Kofleriaceae bacterium]|jgi:hypothetical protein
MKILSQLDLATITGGTSASGLVLDKLNSKYGSDGVVSYIGKPTFGKPNASGVEHASGKFDVNALWGGDTKRSFNASVNPKSGAVSGLHTKLLGSE